MYAKHNLLLLSLLVGSSAAVSAIEPSRDELLKTAQRQQQTFLSAHWVAYRVEQTNLDKSARSNVHVYGFEETPAKFWFGEHAVGLEKEWLSYTNLERPRTRKSVCKCSDGKFVFDVRDGDLLQIHRGAGIHAMAVLPEEDLYREVIGLDSRRASIGITLRGYGNTEPYSIVAMLKDPSFVVSEATLDSERSVKIAKPGVSEAWLDPENGFCLVKMNRYLDGIPHTTLTNSKFNCTLGEKFTFR